MTNKTSLHKIYMKKEKKITFTFSFKKNYFHKFTTLSKGKRYIL